MSKETTSGEFSVVGFRSRPSWLSRVSPGKGLDWFLTLPTIQVQAWMATAGVILLAICLLVPVQPEIRYVEVEVESPKPKLTSTYTLPKSGITVEYYDNANTGRMSATKRRAGSPSGTD